MSMNFNEFGDHISDDEDNMGTLQPPQLPSESDGVFGDAEILVEDEDLMPIETPLIAPVLEEKHDFLIEAELSGSDAEYLEFVTAHNPQCVAFLGPHTAGKTALVEFLVTQSQFPRSRPAAVFDCTADERHRRLTMHAHACFAILGEISGKSLPVHVLDLPGHPAFAAEARVGARLADSLVLVVDVISGLDELTAALVREISDCRPIKLVLAKIDRLAIELRVSPEDAFTILRHRIDQVNRLLFGEDSGKFFSPLKQNVVFASANGGFVFTLASWTQSPLGNPEIPEACLWGDFFFNPETSEISKDASSWSATPAFVALVLEPLWKVIAASACSSELWKWSRKFLRLKYAKTAELSYSKILADLLADSNAACLWDFRIPEISDSSELVLLVTPSHRPDFRLVRVLQGVLDATQATTLRCKAVSGSESEISSLGLQLLLLTPAGRVSVSRVSRGNVVLVSGNFPQTGVYSESGERRWRSEIPGNLRQAVMCVDVEAADAEKMKDALTKVQSLRPGFEFKMLEISSFRLLGTQELHLDQILRETRKFGAAVKVADPGVVFMETCADVSASVASGLTANKKLKIELFAEPLNEQISDYLDCLTADAEPDSAELERRGLDRLSVKSIIAAKNGNLLLDETAETLDAPSQISGSQVRDALISGFEWATGEGPLIGERVRGVAFRVIRVASDAGVRVPPGQVVPLMRRLCHEALRTALPRIAEPLFAVHALVASEKLVAMVQTVLSKRRGCVTSETPVSGTPFVEISGKIPAMETLGLETDLRMASGNQIVLKCRFDGHRMVPGDPTDATIPIKALAVVPSVWLGRDVFVKVRRQKRMNLEI